jgi:hypothetical protein
MIAAPSQTRQFLARISATDPARRITTAPTRAYLTIAYKQSSFEIDASSTHFLPRRSAKVPPVNMPTVFATSAKPCQKEMTWALIAGFPSMMVFAIVATKAIDLADQHVVITGHLCGLAHRASG